MKCELHSDIFNFIQKFKGISFGDFNIEISNNAKGEGYIGEILFITLTNITTLEKEFLVIKQQKVQQDNEFVEWSNGPFENEICFYDKIWPYLKKLFEDKTGQCLDIIPNFLGSTRDDVKRLVMENLKATGYNINDKTKPFTEEQLTMIFKTYGMFHGISMALKEKNCEEFSRLVSGLSYFWKDVFLEDEFHTRRLLNMLPSVRKFFDPLTERHLLDKLDEFEQRGPDLVHKTLNEESGPKVLTHGDCWSNNFLFKYDSDQKLKKVKLIDFQFVGNASPAHDLSYFLYCGGTGKDFQNLEYYFRIYHASLSNTLEDFEVDVNEIYPITTLQEDWKKYSKFGFAMGLMAWRVKLTKPEAMMEVLDLEDAELIEDKEDEYKQRIRDLVIHMYDYGFL